MSAVFDAEALYLALDKRRRERRISYRQLLREAGVPSVAAMTRLGQHRQVSAENLARLLLWLGDTDLRPFLNTPEVR